MAVQFGVVGGDDQRRPAGHGAGEPFDLLLAVEHEVAGVVRGPLQRRLRVVRLFLVGAAGDLVVFDAEQAADARLVQVRPQVVVVEVEADVAVEVAVVVVAGVALDGAPDLLGRLGVAAEGGDGGAGALDRGVDAELRPRRGEQDAVRVGEEVADAGVVEQVLDALDVAALRQPDALRPFAEVPFKLAAADLDLCPAGVLVAVHQRQKAVRGAAGDQLQLARLEEAAEAAQEVVAILPNEDIWASGWNCGDQRVRSISFAASAMRLSSWRR